MKFLKTLTAKKCLIMWLVSYICFSVIDTVYVYWNAETYTPATFDILEKEPGFLVVLLLYYLLFAFPLSIMTNVFSLRENNRTIFILSIVFILWTFVGFIATLFYLAQGMFV